jgi:hypothetical protein
MTVGTARLSPCFPPFSASPAPPSPTPSAA